MKLTKLLFSTITTCLALSSCKTKKIDEDYMVPAPELYNNGIQRNMLQYLVTTIQIVTGINIVLMGESGSTKKLISNSGVK